MSFSVLAVSLNTYPVMREPNEIFRALTRHRCSILVHVQGHEPPLEFVAANPRRANEHDGAGQAGAGVEAGHLLIGRHLFPVKVLTLGSVVDDLFDLRGRPTAWRLGEDAPCNCGKISKTIK